MINVGCFNPNEKIKSPCYHPNKVSHPWYLIETVTNPLLMQCVGAAWMKMRGNIVQLTLSLPPFMINLELLILGCNNIVFMKPKDTWNLMIQMIKPPFYI